MLLASELGISCSVDGGCMLREYNNLALRLLCGDLRHRAVEPCEVGAVCTDVDVEIEALDTLEVLQRPREDVEILWVEGGLERASQNCNRWGEVVAGLVEEDELSVRLDFENKKASMGFFLEDLSA